MIQIKRDSGWTDRARAYKVVVDGKVIGKIHNGEEASFETTPGQHELVLKIDWCKSNYINFEAGNEITQFECGSNLRGWKIFLSLIYITFLKNQYIYLKKKS